MPITTRHEPGVGWVATDGQNTATGKTEARAVAAVTAVQGSAIPPLTVPPNPPALPPRLGSEERPGNDEPQP